MSNQGTSTPRRTVRRLLAIVIAGLALAAATVWFVFPELLIKAASVHARRAAGLELRSADIAGHHIVYLDGGSGPTIVLLHGFGANKDLWDTVAAQLTPHYRVIAPDLPGFGDSPVVDGARYDAQSQAQRVRALLDALGVRDHHIGGNSMGGFIATTYTAAYPDSVRSLLISDAPGVRFPVQSELQQLIASGENPLLARDQADVERLFDLVLYREPDLPAPILRAMGSDYLARRATFERIWGDFGLLRPRAEGALEPLLPQISVPTLVLWGAGDEMTDVSGADVFVGLLPHARKVVLENCGHSPALECPAPMAQQYLAFLDSIADRTAGGIGGNDDTTRAQLPE
jgi:pimeloyl-ACP methyl ester carboxylesterase